MKKIILAIVIMATLTVGAKHSMAKIAIKIDDETVYKEAFHRPVKELKEASDRWLYKSTTGLFSSN